MTAEKLQKARDLDNAISEIKDSLAIWEEATGFAGDTITLVLGTKRQQVLIEDIDFDKIKSDTIKKLKEELTNLEKAFAAL